MSLARVRERMKKRKDRYVVGYIGQQNLLFSSSKHGGVNESGEAFMKPMTMRQADKLLMEMPCRNAAVFEIVPVVLNTEMA